MLVCPVQSWLSAIYSYYGLKSSRLVIFLEIVRKILCHIFLVITFIYKRKQGICRNDLHKNFVELRFDSNCSYLYLWLVYQVLKSIRIWLVGSYLCMYLCMYLCIYLCISVINIRTMYNSKYKKRAMRAAWAIAEPIIASTLLGSVKE